MQRRSMVLPAPDGPRMLSGASSAVNDTFSVKSTSFFAIWISSVTSAPRPTGAPRASCVRPVVESAQQREGNQQIDHTPNHRPPKIVCFHSEVDGDGNRCCPSGYVSGENQGRHK